MISAVITAFVLLVSGALLFFGGFVFGYVKGVRKKQPTLNDIAGAIKKRMK